MTKPRLAAIVKRRVNKNGFARATNQLVSTSRKQRSVKSDEGRLKAAGNPCLAAPPCGSCAHKRELITVKACNPGRQPSRRIPTSTPMSFIVADDRNISCISFRFRRGRAHSGRLSTLWREPGRVMLRGKRVSQQILTRWLVLLA